MDAETQAKFVEELAGNVVRELVADIRAGKTPDNWNGIELRRLLAYRFKLAVVGDMSRSRLRDFNNTVVVNNL